MSSFDKSLSAFASAVAAETSTSAAALKVTPASGGGPPELTRDADGGATLTFFMVEVGDTGFQAAVKCVVRRDAQGSYSYALARA